MLKLIQWAYNKGKQHERLRIKLLLAEHRQTRPDSANYDSRESDQYQIDLNLWYAVEGELQKLIHLYPQPLDMEDEP